MYQKLELLCFLLLIHFLYVLKIHVGLLPICGHCRLSASFSFQAIRFFFLVHPYCLRCFQKESRICRLKGKAPKFTFGTSLLLCMSLSSDYEKARLMERNFQSFIDIRNSSLLSVRFIRSWMEFMASIEFMSAIYLRRIHIRSSVVRS